MRRALLVHILAIAYCAQAQLPSLEELSSDYIEPTDNEDLPSLSNAIGSVGTLPDIVDASSFIVSPLISGTSMLTMRLGGHELGLSRFRWSAYETTRVSVPVHVGCHVLTTTSALRMLHNEAALLWEVTIEDTIDPECSPAQVKTRAEGPTLEVRVATLARKMDEMGWIVKGLPDNPEDFVTTVLPHNSSTGQPAMVLHADTKSPARSGFVFIGPQPLALDWVRHPGRPKADHASASLPLPLGSNASITLRFGMAMGQDSQEALQARLIKLSDGFGALWSGVASEWTSLWSQAFTPHANTDPQSPFSGYLPTLHTADQDVRRVYYSAALTLLCMRRVGVGAVGGRGWVTGLGNTCWLITEDPAADVDCLKPRDPRDTPLHPVSIGANAQFYWDTSLRSLLTSLLDPVGMRGFLHAVLSMDPPGSFQSNFGIDTRTGQALGYAYSFNAHSLFNALSTYLRVTNDTSLLRQDYGGQSVASHLEDLALEWRGLKSSAEGVAYVADYGENVDNFLECVPSYIHAVPALQAANVEMLSWLSDLRTREGNSTGASLLQSLALNLTEEMQTRMYQRGQGFWSCLYPNNTAMPVRHVIDFLYIARGLEAGGRGPGLGTQIHREMGRFFRSELQGKTWLRALSPIDTLARTLPINDAILRPDHGITGSYDAWAALCVEALGIVDGDWANALQFLRDTSAVTHRGPYGQAHELPPDAPSAFKTKRGFTRFIADNGASFGEAVIRGLFGYDPPFLSPLNLSLPFHGLETSFLHPQQPRADFIGTLTGLRTPYGEASVSVGPEGVRLTAIQSR